MTSPRRGAPRQHPRVPAGRRPAGRVALAATVLGSLALLVGCAPTGGANPSGTAGASGTPPASAPAMPPPTIQPTTPPADPLAGLTREQRVGQLFMVGTSAGVAEAETLAAVRDRHVGNVFLSGRSAGGVGVTGSVVAQLTGLVGPATTAGIPLLVSTDQEGGKVQVLSGPGFSPIPSGLAQGALDPAILAADARGWGAELAAAGLNMNLAPVVDLVASPQAAAGNPPIGAFQREYGYKPAAVRSHTDAFRTGMGDSGITTVLKHFPGLGAVTENTDTSASVTDSTTSSTSASVGIYRDEIAGGAPSIMMSSATYTLLDPRMPAVFSPAIVQGVLRGELGFTGLVMTDDMSGAAQVQAWSPGERAILAIDAGVDMVLVSKTPALAAQMVDAVLAKAQSDPVFDAKVNAAAARVFALKTTL